MSEISNNEILELLKNFMDEDIAQRYLDSIPPDSHKKNVLFKKLAKIKPMKPIPHSLSILRSSSRDSIDLFTPEAMNEIEIKKQNFKTNIPIFWNYISGLFQHIEFVQYMVNK